MCHVFVALSHHVCKVLGRKLTDNEMLVALAKWPDAHFDEDRLSETRDGEFGLL